jgi:small ligand-binding sensory domain FIST
MLLEIDGEAALDVLGAAGRDLEGQPLIFVALARPNAGAASSTRPSQLSLRPIQGVDPGRRGLILGEHLPTGLLAAFAVRDAAAARSDLLAMTRDLVRDTAGAAPRFGVYVNCAGRGSTLYSAPNVDSRLLRTRLGDIPIVGFQSAFEFVPQGDRLALSLYTGVLGLFTAPS